MRSIESRLTVHLYVLYITTQRNKEIRIHFFAGLSRDVISYNTAKMASVRRRMCTDIYALESIYTWK